MVTSDELRSVEVELERVTDRLNSMPLVRAATTTADCYSMAELLLSQTRLLDDNIPTDASLPMLGPQGLGSLIAVLGWDYADAAKAAPLADAGPVIAGLIDLRRSLP